MLSVVSYQPFKSVKQTSEKITKADKYLVIDLNYEEIKFLVSKKDFKKNKTEKESNIWTNLFCYENNLAHPVYVSDEKLKNYMGLVVIINENKLHYVFIKDLTDLCAMRQGVKIKTTFASIIYNVLVVKEFWKNIG